MKPSCGHCGRRIIHPINVVRKRLCPKCARSMYPHLKRGHPYPRRKPIIVHTIISRKLMEQLTAKRTGDGLTMAEIVRRALKEYVANEPR